LSDEEALTLFCFPRACSLATHIVLEETGLAYERQLVDIRPGHAREAGYVQAQIARTVLP
jgi:glutathione S-transferase